MGLTDAIKAALEGLFASTASKVAAEEVKAWSPWIANRITKCAIGRLPQHRRGRYQEEWASHLQDVPGNIGKLMVAIGFYSAARKIAVADPDNVSALVWLARHVLVSLVPFTKRIHSFNSKTLKALKENPNVARSKLVRSPLIDIGILLVDILLSVINHLFKIAKIVPNAHS